MATVTQRQAIELKDEIYLEFRHHEIPQKEVNLMEHEYYASAHGLGNYTLFVIWVCDHTHIHHLPDWAKQLYLSYTNNH